MNKQHLQNLIELADMACATGRIVDDDQMIAAAVAKKAARALLARMADGQVLLPAGEPTGAAKNISDLNKEERQRNIAAGKKDIKAAAQSDAKPQ